MTSADSLRQVLLRSSNSVRKASQGKNTIFPVIYPPHLHREFRIAWGFSFFGNLTHSHMPDAVPVRRTNGLPRASFRFHLTMDTLAFGYALGAIPCARDFHPLDCAHAWHTKQTPDSAYCQASYYGKRAVLAFMLDAALRKAGFSLDEVLKTWFHEALADPQEIGRASCRERV